MWVENAIGLFEGAADGFEKYGLATEADIAAAIEELRRHLDREDASALFHWNRAVAMK
jgi:hypothetical protein